MKERVLLIGIKRPKATQSEMEASLVESALSRDFKHVHLRLPHTADNVLSELYRLGDVASVKRDESAIFVEANLSNKLVGRYRKYCI